MPVLIRKLDRFESLFEVRKTFGNFSFLLYFSGCIEDNIKEEEEKVGKRLISNDTKDLV